ncbi:MAG: capsule assembly Wzi family protein, partial [candidate division KSB1 bacterium]|nr:capsule assembly Wzi family protein [candidate division KSB1 bacterium]
MNSRFDRMAGQIGQWRSRGIPLRCRGWLVVLFWLGAVQAQTIEVPMSHWSYRLLDRLRTRGLLELGLTGSRPLTREALTRALLTAFLAPGDRLDHSEREALEFAFFEFSEEVARLGSGEAVRAASERQRARQEKWLAWLPRPLYANRRNLLSLESGALRFFLDPIFHRDAWFNDSDTLARQERVLQDTGGFMFWGTLGRHLGFHLSSRDTREHGTRSYPTSSRLAWPRHGFARGYGTHVYHDETVAYLYLTLVPVRVAFGKNVNRWGPGYTGALALNDYATSYDQLKLSLQAWRAQFTYVHAALRQHPP